MSAFAVLYHFAHAPLPREATFAKNDQRFPCENYGANSHFDPATGTGKIFVLIAVTKIRLSRQVRRDQIYRKCTFNRLWQAEKTPKKAKTCVFMPIQITRMKYVLTTKSTGRIVPLRNARSYRNIRDSAYQTRGRFAIFDR